MYLVQGVEDLVNDEEVGFKLISTDDIDDYGINEIIRRIRDRIGDSPVYLRSVHSNILRDRKAYTVLL